MCGLQFSVSWLQLPGRCNLRLSHKQIHTEKDRRVGCIFIISLLWNRSPESQKGPAARTVDFFFLHRRQKQCNTESRRSGRPLRAVRGRAVCPIYTPTHADTQQECTRRVYRGQRSTVGCGSLYCILCPCNGQITLLNRQIR